MKNKEIKFNNLKELIISVAYYIGGSVFGPILLFGGLGYVLDRVLDTKPKMLIIGFIISFVVTNILMFRKLKKLNVLMDSINYRKNGDNNTAVSKK